MAAKRLDRRTGTAIALLLAGLLVGATAAEYAPGRVATVTETVTSTATATFTETSVSTTTAVNTLTESASTSTLTATSTTTSTATSTTTSVSTVSVNEGPLLFASGVSPEGLQLKVELNASSALMYGVVGAQIEVVNTLGKNVSTPVSVSPTVSQWNGVDEICGDNPSYSLAGFAVFKGAFDAENLSAAGPPLRMAPPFYPPCTAPLSTPHVVFYPYGDETLAYDNYGTPQQESFPLLAAMNATTQICQGLSQDQISCGGSPGLVGYWNSSVPLGGDATFTSKAFVYFPVGTYTLVAADDWDQYVYATFTID